MSQQQIADVFAFKWKKRDTYSSAASIALRRDWLLERYGDVAAAPWWNDYPDPVLLDAGCGAGMSALALFGDRLKSVHYVGVDISDAVDEAKEAFARSGYPGTFRKIDLMSLTDIAPDVIFSEGVLHHTDSTRDALHALAKLLKPGGRFLFYVYRRKGPIREFTDDFIREKLSHMAPQDAWDAMRGLTLLGKALGELGATVDIPEPIPMLGIPAGKIDVQRLFYWHVCKAFYRPDFTIDEMRHINFDWFAPKNAHRQSVGEVRAWCAECGLAIEREYVDDAGITVQAIRT